MAWWWHGVFLWCAVAVFCRGCRDACRRVMSDSKSGAHKMDERAGAAGIDILHGREQEHRALAWTGCAATGTTLL